MRLEAGKTERQITRKRLAQAAAQGGKVGLRPDEALVWMKRAFALDEYRQTGASTFIQAEAYHLGLTCDQVIDLYRNRLNDIKVSLLSVFTDDLTS